MNDVLLARAKWRDHKDGPEDAIVSEMMKKLPMEKIYTIARCVSRGVHGISKFAEGWESCVFEEARCSPD